jgi:hypothetical protein
MVFVPDKLTFFTPETLVKSNVEATGALRLIVSMLLAVNEPVVPVTLISSLSVVELSKRISLLPSVPTLDSTLSLNAVNLNVLFNEPRVAEMLPERRRGSEALHGCVCQ